MGLWINVKSNYVHLNKRIELIYNTQIIVIIKYMQKLNVQIDTEYKYFNGCNIVDSYYYQNQYTIQKKKLIQFEHLRREKSQFIII